MADKTYNDKIIAIDTEITVVSKGNDDDFISLTDIANFKNANYPSEIIQNWMRNRSTVEYLGLWERIHNPNFNYLEFEVIDSEAGRNTFVLTPKRWIESVNAIGMTSKAGRYASTFAHKDIAFKFASWISVELELYVILSNMESINALLIRQGLPQNERLIQLNNTAITQMNSLVNGALTKRLE